MTERSFTKNPGFLSLNDLPDMHVVGAVVVQMDDAGEYHTTYLPVDLDGTPVPEVQEVQGAQVAQAFELANLTGMSA